MCLIGHGVQWEGDHGHQKRKEETFLGSFLGFLPGRGCETRHRWRM